MSKSFTCKSKNILKEKKRAIISQIDFSLEEISSVFLNHSAVETARKIKFQKLISDTVFKEQLNFIEYINQAFTYLVCLCAGEMILEKFTQQTIVINLGTAPGYDVVSTDETIICECFSVTSVKSNSKLKNDIVRLNKNQSAKHKWIVFYSENFIKEQDYINRLQNQYPDIKLTALSFDQLTKI